MSDWLKIMTNLFNPYRNTLMGHLSAPKDGEKEALGL
jgi:hypothetical protein